MPSHPSEGFFVVVGTAAPVLTIPALVAIAGMAIRSGADWQEWRRRSRLASQTAAEEWRAVVGNKRLKRFTTPQVEIDIEMQAPKWFIIKVVILFASIFLDAGATVSALAALGRGEPYSGRDANGAALQLGIAFGCLILWAVVEAVWPTGHQDELREWDVTTAKRIPRV